MTDNIMFVETFDPDTATELKNIGLKMFSYRGGRYVFIYDDAILNKYNLEKKYNLTNTLYF